MFLKVDPISAKQFEKGIDDWLLETEKNIVDVFRGFAVALFNYAVWETPQWSGSAASNWNLRYGYPSSDVGYELKIGNISERGSLSGSRNVSRLKFGVPVSQKGDGRAMTVAVARNADKPSTIIGHSLDIFITNASKSLSGESYIEMLETNPNNYLRAVNEPGHMLAYGSAKAMVIFADINQAQEAQLKSLSLGDPVNAGLR